MKWFKTVLNKAKNIGEIFIYGEITDEKWFDEDVTPTDVKKELDKIAGAKSANLYVNSPGGGVFAGMAMYNMLKRFEADITGYVDGIAASIASVILMAANKIIIPESAMMMVHDPMGMAFGVAEEMRKTADMLDRVKTSIAATYVERTGKKETEIVDLMSAETWMTGREAVNMGFADALDKERKITALAGTDKLTINGVEYFPSKFQAFPVDRIGAAANSGGRHRENALKLIKLKMEGYL